MTRHRQDSAMAVTDTRSEGEDETRRNGTGRDGDAKGGDGETVMSTSMVTLVARGGEARTRERGTRAGRRMMMPMPMAMPMTMTTRMKTVTRAVVDGGRGGETMSSVSMWSSSSSSIERGVDEDETEAEAGTRATSEAAAAREAETEGSFAVALGTLAGGSATCYGLGSVLGIDLRGPGSVVTAIGVLAVIITVHECGHFFAARARGIHVNQFAVGFGPNLFTYRGPEVEYSLKAIPLGGYVAFPDDDEDCPYPEDDPDLLRNRPTGDRALVVSAGIIANVIFAFGILYNQVTTIGFAEQTYEPGVVVKAFTNGSVAKEAGIEVGDIILSVDGDTLLAKSESVSKVVNTVKESPNELVKFELMRLDASGAPEVKVVEVRPSAGPGGNGKVGVKLASNSSVAKHIANNPFEAAFLSAKEFSRLTALVWNSLTGLFFNFNENKEQVSGPIAIVATGAEVMRNEVSGLYQFAAVININLAIVNLLPLPALDGGFLLFIVIEALRGGKKIPVEIEQGITGAGVLFLFVSGASLILRDTINLIPH